MTLVKPNQRKEVSDFLSDRVKSVSPSGIRKFFDLLSSMEGVISLGVGEPDFVTPWHVREAAIHSLEQGYTMYTSNLGILELRQELARHLESTYGLEYDPTSELLITTGVSEGLDLALRAVINPGEEVIVPDPCYVAYTAGTILAGGRPIPIPTTSANAFKIAAADIENNITDRTKALLMGYPSNPTGAVMSREELAQISAVVQKHDLIAISDEIYSRLVYGTTHVSLASLPGMRQRTILLGGFSKAYAMTGWRIGYAAARREIIEAMTKIHQYSMMCVPTMAQYAALEALKRGDPEVTAMVQDYDRRRRLMVNGLVSAGLPCFEPKGAFYAFPSIRATGMTSEQFAEELLTKEKVAVIPGSVFGPSGEGHVRCCYATSLAEIEEAIARITRFVQENASRKKPV